MEWGENTTTISQREHKVTSINGRKNVAKAAILQTGGFKLLLKSLKRTEERKMVSFIRKRENAHVYTYILSERGRLKSLKTQQKTKKQFILAHKC